MNIRRSLNAPVSSNTYIVYEPFESSCIVVDPGTPNAVQIIHFCEDNQLIPEYIILTHEHFDHIWEYNILRNKYRLKLICSRVCAEQINKPQNYFNLLYFNKEEILRIENADIALDSVNYTMAWKKTNCIYEYSRTYKWINLLLC